MILKKLIHFVFFNLIVLLAFPKFSLTAQNFPPIIINNNSKYTSSPEGKVELKLSMNGAKEMMVSNFSDFRNGNWESYAVIKEWYLEKDDGLKSVFIKFKDQGDRESKVFSASINLDRVPPSEPKIIINNDHKFTTNYLRQVNLNLKAKEADQMLIANDSTFQGARWMPYAESFNNWALFGNEGVKAVYVKFKDKAGNESDRVKDEIILDLLPPTIIFFQINKGAKLTNQEKVELSIGAREAAEILIKEVNAEWRPFREEIEGFILDGEDGLKTVSIKLRDEAGNISNPVSAQIRLDRMPPRSPRISINNNRSYTSDPSKKVIINLYAEEAVELRVSEDSTFEDVQWENYKTAINWTLSEGDGKKVVYAAFKDLAGNITQTVKSQIILDRSSPDAGSLTINGGESVTNKTQVILQFKSPEAQQMMVGNNVSFLGSMWEKFNSEKRMNLQGRDGEKWFFVKYKDAAGNISEPLSASIILDRMAPTETGLKINNGIGYCTDPEAKVVLSLKAKDAKAMLISNTHDFTGVQWQSFQETLEWKLSGSDGLKVVGVKFRDEAGNISRVVTARVKLARSATVKGKFNINSDSLITKNQHKKVDLNISAQGAKDMMVSNFEDFREGEWEEYKTHKIWTLSEGDGEKTVFVKFKGFVGNESKVYTDKIIMDRSAPQNCKVLINNDSLFTVNRSNKVKLTLRATNAVKMIISNNPVFQGAVWEDYKPLKYWTLDKEEGVKTVYARFKDEVGNESDVVSDQILLDKTAPLNVAVRINNGAEFTNNPRKAVTLVFDAQGAAKMRISNSPNIENSEWEVISNKKLNWILPGEDGEKRVYVQYKDEGENVSAVVFDKITLDRNPPKNCAFTINNDSLFAKHEDVRLYILGEDVSNILISNRRDFFGARWEAFKSYKAHWILDGEDGEKTIYMAFRDAAGNIYPDTLSRNIILDRTPPYDISVSVKGGDKAIHKKVVLHLKAKDAEVMEIRNKIDEEGNWEPFEESKEWVFQEGEEERNIWIRFRDRAGNLTEFFTVFQNQ